MSARPRRRAGVPSARQRRPRFDGKSTHRCALSRHGAQTSTGQTGGAHRDVQRSSGRITAADDNRDPSRTRWLGALAMPQQQDEDMTSALLSPAGSGTPPAAANPRLAHPVACACPSHANRAPISASTPKGACTTSFSSSVSLLRPCLLPSTRGSRSTSVFGRCARRPPGFQRFALIRHARHALLVADAR